MSGSTATHRFRQASDDLVTLAVADLRRFWATLDLANPVEVRRQVEDFLPDLVQTYGEIGAALAADLYDELRHASPHAPNPYTARMTDNVVRLDQVRASARWAIGPLFGDTTSAAGAEVIGLAAAKTARGLLATAPEAAAAGGGAVITGELVAAGAATAATLAGAAALARLTGATKRLTLAPARETIRDNTRDDPDAVGWRRVGDGSSCRFCRMLIGRGEVYTKETVRFGAHDSCGCAAEPAWGQTEPVTVEQYLATKRTITEKDRARVRDFLSNMPEHVALQQDATRAVKKALAA